MKRAAVVLSGCGVFDGSEVHEATLVLLYLDRAGFEVKCFAPDKPQADVIDHRNQSDSGGTRNVLSESARIARGSVAPLNELKVDDYDAVIFPGGYGAAKNLSSFASDGPKCDVDPDVARVTRETVKKKKVLATLCISPAVTARALMNDDVKPKLTVGTDPGTMNALRAMDAEPVEAQVNEIVVDEKNRIVSTPAYMLGKRISEVAEGIEKLVKKVDEMTG